MENYKKKRVETIRLQSVTNYWHAVINFKAVIIRYGLSDTDVYQNKWACRDSRNRTEDLQRTSLVRNGKDSGRIVNYLTAVT